MDTPVFSVLIANYNNGQYLQEAITSVENQSYTNWEIIIVDDGSTDNSEAIYECLNDPRIHVFHHDDRQNHGVGYTKHQAVLHAHGQYCGFLDPDDALLPNALEVTTKILDSDENISLAMSRCYYCDESLHIIAERPLFKNIELGYLESRNNLPGNFAAFRKKHYMCTGGIDITLKAGDDDDLYYKLEEVGKLSVCETFTYLYRRTPNSITSNIDRSFYWTIIARHNACIRRGLRPEDFSMRDWLTYLSENRWHSRAYRIGKLILNPSTYFKYMRNR